MTFKKINYFVQNVVKNTCKTLLFCDKIIMYSYVGPIL